MRGWDPALIENLPPYISAHFDCHVFKGISVKRSVANFLLQSCVSGTAFRNLADGLNEIRNIERDFEVYAYLDAEMRKRSGTSFVEDPVPPMLSRPESTFNGHQLATLLERIHQSPCATQGFWGSCILEGRPCWPRWNSRCRSSRCFSWQFHGA